MRAVQARDHFLFQQFFQFASLLYILGIEKPEDSPVRAWMIERSWRWPKEIADFYIGHGLHAKTSTPEDLEQMRDFALYSLRVYQDLLKLMADKRDITAFGTVAHEVRKLYGRFREADDQPNLAILRFQLEHTQNDEQRELVTSQLERQEKRQAVAAAINMAIDEIFLALAGRVLAQRLEAPEDAVTGHLLDAIIALLPNSLDTLAATFAEASGWHASDTWGWNQWDMVADGEAHWVDTHTKLNQIFAVRALQLLAVLPPEIAHSNSTSRQPYAGGDGTRRQSTGITSDIECDRGQPRALADRAEPGSPKLHRGAARGPIGSFERRARTGSRAH